MLLIPIFEWNEHNAVFVPLILSQKLKISHAHMTL